MRHDLGVKPPSRNSPKGSTPSNLPKGTRGHGPIARPDRGFNPEAALLACAAGDQTALRMIYEQEGPRLLAVAYRIVRRRELAEDVLQDAFLQIWRHAHTFEPSRGSARGWIYSVVHHRALKLRRAGLREFAVEDPAMLVIDGGTDPSLRLPEECALRRALERLGAKQRASLTLAYMDGCSYRDIAEQLGVPIGTAKAWIRRGLITLREMLTCADVTGMENPTGTGNDSGKGGRK